MNRYITVSRRQHCMQPSTDVQPLRRRQQTTEQVRRAFRRYGGTHLWPLVLCAVMALGLAPGNAHAAAGAIAARELVTAAPTANESRAAPAAVTITVDRSDDPDSGSLGTTCGYTDGIYAPAADGCSLRRALIEAGARPLADRPIAIEFGLAPDDPGYDASTDTWTLVVDAPLVLKGASSLQKEGQVTLDGATQPGGRSSGPKIMIDTNDHRLEVMLEKNTIAGLGFFGGGIIELKEDGNTVERIWMGLSVDGRSIVLRTPDRPERLAGGGIVIAADSNLVQGNVLAGTYASAIIIDGSDNNVVRNNSIGTRADGTVPDVAETIACLRSFSWDPNNWYGGWGISVSGANNEIRQNRIAGLHILQSENDTPPRAIELFGRGHVVQGNVIGWDREGNKVGVCGQGIKVSGRDTAILENIIVRSRLDSEDAEGAAILASDTSPQFGQITVRGNLVERGPGKVFGFGPGIPDSLALFQPAQITGVDGLTVSGSSGEGSPCPNCIIDLYRDDADGDQEAFALLGSVEADDNGDFSLTLDEPLPAGQGLRTASTTQSAGIIGSFGAGTSTKLSALYLPLNSVQIEGPTVGELGETLAFSLTTEPATSEEIYRYRVQATDFSAPLVFTANSRAGFDISWTQPGPKRITVTVDNGFDTVTASYAVTIEDNTPVDPQGSAIYLPLVAQ